MSFIFLFLFALLTKPILESAMVRGELGFFKTYFVFGCLVSVVFFVAWFSFSTNNVVEMHPGEATLKLPEAIKVMLTIASFYYLILSLSLYNVSKKTPSANVRRACYCFIFVLLFNAGVGIFMTLVSAIIYLIMMFCTYKYMWQKDFMQEIKRLYRA